MTDTAEVATEPTHEIAEAPPQPSFVPKTREDVEAAVEKNQWRVELNMVLETLSQAHLELAQMKIMMRLEPAGDVPMHHNQLRQKADQAAQRIRILKEAWLDLQSQEPLPGAGLEVVSGLVIAGE